MVYNLTKEKSDVIAKALSQLPQKVSLLSSIKQPAFFFLSLTLPLANLHLIGLIFICISAGNPMARSWALQKQTAESSQVEIRYSSSSFPTQMVRRYVTGQNN